MNKTQAAEILANLVVVTARRYGWTGTITNEMIDTVVTEAQTELRYSDDGAIRKAGIVRPSNQAIRAAGKAAA